MEEKTIIAYEGKFFTVTLQSMLGSTNYGWCLASLPDGIVLAGIDNQPMHTGISPVNQNFYFGVAAISGDVNVVIKFKLCCLSDFKKVPEEVSINVQLVPANVNSDNANSDNASFVKYSENSAVYNTQPPYGYVLSQADLMYGYPCNVKYGYPGCDDINLKYGYPSCGFTSSEYPVVKYGYPCGALAILKYGVPCGSQISLKYGYPCFDNPTLKYGYPCGLLDDYPPLLKYGYPTCQ